MPENSRRNSVSKHILAVNNPSIRINIWHDRRRISFFRCLHLHSCRIESFKRTSLPHRGRLFAWYKSILLFAPNKKPSEISGTRREHNRIVWKFFYHFAGYKKIIILFGFSFKHYDKLAFLGIIFYFFDHLGNRAAVSGFK